jgi:hypothetical protein
MVKLAARTVKPPKAPKATITSTRGKKPDTVTFNMGAGYSREAKSELFLLAVTNMVSEDTFYEKAGKRDERFTKLVRQVALEDPDWVARFVPYLRDTMNMRSASIVMAAELVHAKLTQPVPASKITNRQIIDSAIRRADEPAELLGYWMSEYRKNIPQPVKRGLADAVQRVYSERNLIKYDGGDKPIRFADVIDLVHPEAKAAWQGALYEYALADRHKRAPKIHEDGIEKGLSQLGTLRYNLTAMALSNDTFRGGFSPEFVENAGLTWEQASSKYGKLDARFWEAMIPNMGIFALVRNLRNFDDAGISAEAQAIVRAKLTDAETIKRSRMFPLRFFTAFLATKTLTYARELEDAIDLSLSNVPALTGKTLILVDISRSMDWALSAKSDVTRLAPASIFGAALAIRAEHPTLVAFTDTSKEIHVRKNQSVLLTTKEIADALPHSGTQTFQSVKQHLKDHDRVIILTDEQADPATAYWGAKDTTDKDPSTIIPETVPLFTFNVAGYHAGHAPSGKKNRYAFGGLSDAAFTAIELLETGQDEVWPF